MRAFSSFFMVLAFTWALPAGEIDQVEAFALAKDRSEFLKTLIPGTEPYYFYNCLHLLQTEKPDQCMELTKAWHARHGQTALLTEIQLRHAFGGHDKDPRKTIDYLSRHLGVRHEHQRVIPGSVPNLPTALDPKAIDQALLTESVLARANNHLDLFEDKALERLAANTLTPDQRRSLLRRLSRPDLSGLVKLILDDLSTNGAGPFGSMPIHNRLTLSQLEELEKAQPGLLNQQNFVLAILARLRPGADDDWRGDKALAGAYIDRMLAFVRRLGPVHNSLKAHVLNQKLALERSQGRINKALVLEYLALPRQRHYQSKALLESDESRRFPVDLNASYSGSSLLPPIRDDEPLVRDLLLELLRTEDSTREYLPFVNDVYLNHLLVEAKVTSGLGDPENWASKMPPELFRQLRERVDIDFSATSKTFFRVDEPVQLELMVKNVPSMIVKVFEINTGNYYREFKREIDTDVNLDGLVANSEQTLVSNQSPLRREARTLPLPGLTKPGVYVVDFIGNGKSSRALIRKGALRPLARQVPSGHLVTVVDEQNRPVSGAIIHLGAQEFPADKNGQALLPFADSAGRRPIFLSQGSFTCLDYLDQKSELYQLSAGIHIDREALLAGREATVVVRPGLALNGVLISTSKLLEPRLLIQATDLDGIATRQEANDFKVFDDRESYHVIRVPRRMATVTVTLSGKIKVASKGMDEEFTTSETFQINASQKTDKVDDIHLGRDATGYWLEVAGRTGETRADRAAEIVLKHHDFREPVRASLKSDGRGIIKLGLLPGIDRIEATLSNGATRAWPLMADRATQRKVLHVVAGQDVSVPLMTGAIAPQRSEAALFEVRENVIVADRFDRLSTSNGMLVARKLMAGDYDLVLKAQNEVIRIRVVAGPVLEGMVLGSLRDMSLAPVAPLQVAGITRNDAGLTVSLAGTTPMTRVHVLATRYQPAFDMFGQLAKVQNAELSGIYPSKQRSSYITGRDIGDEYRYVLDRRTQKKYPTAMVDRPGLLLNPWAVRDTITGEQNAMEGGVFDRKGTAAASRMAADPQSKRARETAATSDSADIDFLEDASALLVNLVPDKDGIVKVPAARLAGRGIIRVVATDPQSVIARTITAPGAPLHAVDLRLIEALAPTGHFTQRKQLTVVPANTPFIIADIGASRFEVYDSLDKVYGLMATVRNDERFATFRFVTTWLNLKADEKKTLYSKHACHELNVFIHYKDPEFFKSTVAPFLVSKKDKTFVDHWLLGDDLTGYLEPWRHARLNSAEKVLLSRRLAGESARTARWLDERLRLQPPVALQLAALFDTSIARGDLSEKEGLAREQMGLRRGLGRLNEAQADKLSIQGGMLGGMGGGGMGGPAAAFGAVPAAPAPSNAAAAGKPADRFAGRDGTNRESEAKKSDERRKEMGEKAAAKSEMDGVKQRMMLSSDAAPVEKDQKTQYFYRSESLESLEKANRTLYRPVAITREWAENNYHHLPIDQQIAALIPPGRFWLDFARHDGKSPFLSKDFASASGSFTEAMLAISVLDLPFTAGKANIKFEGARMTLVSPTPVIVVHEEVKSTAAPAAQAPILVSQNVFQANDRYRDDNGERMDKFVTGEFVIHTVYGSQVVVTNTSPSRQKLSILIQIPAGSIALTGGKATRSVSVDLEPYRTQTIDTFFYFPLPGKYAQFPVHVAKNEVLLAAGPQATFQVVAKPTRVDTASWDHISQNGSSDEVIAYLERENAQGLDLDKMAFRLRDRGFFVRVTDLLRARHIYHATVWSYAMMHDDVRTQGEFLRQHDGLASQLHNVLKHPLLSLDAVERHAYQHLEYKPLVNARAHALGKARQIVNPILHGQYHALLNVLARAGQLNDSDWLAVTYYLLLQDRVEEALDSYAKVRADKISTHLQFDYCGAYLAMCQEDLQRARELATRHLAHPVDRWRLAFQVIVDQLDEAQGKVAKVAEAGNRDQEQGKLAAAEPSFDVRLDGAAVELTWQNLDKARIQYYVMDVELLFSRNPFLQDFGGQFALIQPNATANINLAAKQGKQLIPLPDALKGKNVLVEISAGGKSRALPYYAGSMKVLVLENYGQVAVKDAAGKPLAKVYVKVYSKLANGRVKFHKDGYTDIRGRFDYASVSTPEPVAVQRFGVLVLSETLGATIRDAAPPAGSERDDRPVPMENPAP